MPTQTIAVRKSKRHDARFLCTLKAQSGSASGRVINLSETGLCVMLFERFQAGPGAPVILQSPELGRIEGHLRWLKDGKAGIEFALNSNALAQVSSYFRFLHGKQTAAARR